LLLLLKHKPNINLQDSTGQTAAHYAALVGNSEILEVLLKNGADVNIRDEDDQTPLDVAADDEIKHTLEKFCTP